MKNHILNLTDLQDFISKEKKCYAMSTISKKRLDIYLNGTIEVIHDNKVVYKGVQAFSAIEVYNEIV